MSKKSHLEQHQETVARQAIEEVIEYEAQERAKVNRWLMEDPNYVTNLTAMRKDPDYQTWAVDWMEHPPVGDPFADPRVMTLGKLELRYQISGAEPRINTPEKLDWWLSKKRNPYLDEGDQERYVPEVRDGKYLNKPIETAREFIIAMRAADPALPQLPGLSGQPREDFRQLVQWCIDAERVVGPRQADENAKGNDTASLRTPKQPSKISIFAYRLYIGGLGNQSQIAAALEKQFRQPVSQGQVSRYIRQTKKYIESGNVLPNYSMLKKPVSVDPNVIDMGPRQDSRTRRQRDRSDGDDTD